MRSANDCRRISSELKKAASLPVTNNTFMVRLRRNSPNRCKKS
jgi:hypothetical protein